MKYAKENKGTNVVIKTKITDRYYSYVKDIAERNGFNNMSNLIITEQGNTYDLMQNCFCVIGFNSTTLIEGLISNKMLISPNICDNDIAGIFDDYPELIYSANNIDEMNKCITRKGPFTKNIYLRNKFLREYISRDDGSSSKYTERVILNTIRMN